MEADVQAQNSVHFQMLINQLNFKCFFSHVTTENYFFAWFFVTRKLNQVQKQPPDMFCKKRCSQKFRKTLYQSLFFNKVAGLRPEACNFIKKETLAQVFPCELCEISKITFFTELWATASVGSRRCLSYRVFELICTYL